MLYTLIKKWKGKEIVLMTDELSKVNDRKKQASSSQRGQRVEFIVRLAEEDEDKYKKEPSRDLGDPAKHNFPKRIK